MKAIIVSEAGGPDKLAYVNHPDPVVGPGAVLVKVEAAGVNHFDIWLRTGKYGSLPLIPGMDAAGVVAAVAPDVEAFKVGDRVLLNPAQTCDACAYCHAGDHGSCRQRKAIGQRLNGAYSQYVALPWRNVHLIRDDLSFEEAAAIPTAFFTAWQLLLVRARLVPGQTVLVMAAASGVGSAAVQIGKLIGARVIAAAGADRKLARARAWGADETINYAADDLSDRVLQLTDGMGVEVVADTVGSGYWARYMKCVRVGGRVVTCGAIAPQLDVNLETLGTRQISFIGCGPQGSKGGAAKVVDLVNRGRLRGVVDRVFALKDAGAAHDALEQRNVIGKMILVPWQRRPSRA